MFYTLFKKSIIVLLIINSCIYAQTISKSDTFSLKKIARDAQTRYQNQQKQIKEEARKRNLKIEWTDKNGKHYKLHHFDAKGTPIYYSTRSNLGSANTIKVSRLWNAGGAGLNLEGQGMEVSPSRARLGMWEPGVARLSHQEYGNRVTMRDLTTFSGDNAENKHATHVAGTMIASGIDASAKGMAPQAKLDGYDSNNDLSEMAIAASEGMLVSNHSYGMDISQLSASDKTLYRGYYDSEAQAWDNICVAAPNYLPIQSAGNDRDDNSPGNTFDLLLGSSNAKNTLGVGAVNIITTSYTQPSDVVMSSFSSYGPSDDGRIKPDVVAAGVAINSSVSLGDDQYALEDGTSMSSPAVAGALFLVQQHYKNSNNGNFLRSDALRGLAIHTAEEAGSNPGPDYGFGWGLMNVEKAINFISNTTQNHVLSIENLANGATFTRQINVIGGQPLKVTIVWIDPAATPLSVTDPNTPNNTTPRLVNDLDVRILDANNAIITDLPWKLNVANQTSAATKDDNLVDNIEQIDVAVPTAGSYTVRVTHKGSLANTQSFALLMTGVSTTSNTQTATTTGLNTENLVSKNVHLYPNPTNDYIHLVSNQKNGEGKATLYDIYGKKLSSSSFLAIENTFMAEFDLKKYANGQYLIYVEGSNEVFKVLKK